VKVWTGIKWFNRGAYYGIL